MNYWVGFDVGKRFHWLCVLDGDGAILLSRRVDATEEQLEAACSEIAALGDVEQRVIGVDVLGGSGHPSGDNLAGARRAGTLHPRNGGEQGLRRLPRWRAQE